MCSEGRRDKLTYMSKLEGAFLEHANASEKDIK